MTFKFTHDQVTQVWRQLTTKQQVALKAQAGVQHLDEMDVLANELDSFLEGAETIIPATVVNNLEFLADRLGVEDETTDEEEVAFTPPMADNVVKFPMHEAGTNNEDDDS